MRKTILFLVILLTSITTFSIDVINDIQETRLEVIKRSEFTLDLLVEYMNIISPELNDIPIRQFILETGWFRSKLFTEYNNIAGMKLARIRETTAVSEALGHASYNHWTDSVDDYVLWVKYHREKGHSIKNYYKFLKNIGYATCKDYERRLRNIKLEV